MTAPRVSLRSSPASASARIAARRGSRSSFGQSGLAQRVRQRGYIFRVYVTGREDRGGDQYPWDLKTDSVMTNATVGTITQSPQGNVIKVSYKGTESEYTVDPTTPIFANATGDRGLLVPGAAVFVIAVKHDDGSLTSARFYVEKDGIKPPM